MEPLRFPLPTLPFCRDFVGFGTGAKVRLEGKSYVEKESGFEVSFLGNGEDLTLRVNVSFDSEGRSSVNLNSKKNNIWSIPVKRIGVGLSQNRIFVIEISVDANEYVMRVDSYKVAEFRRGLNDVSRAVLVAGALIVDEIAIFPGSPCPAPRSRYLEQQQGDVAEITTELKNANIGQQFEEKQGQCSTQGFPVLYPAPEYTAKNERCHNLPKVYDTPQFHTAEGGGRQSRITIPDPASQTQIHDQDSHPHTSAHPGLNAQNVCGGIDNCSERARKRTQVAANYGFEQREQNSNGSTAYNSEYSRSAKQHPGYPHHQQPSCCCAQNARQADSDTTNRSYQPTAYTGYPQYPQPQNSYQQNSYSFKNSKQSSPYQQQWSNFPWQGPSHRFRNASKRENVIYREASRQLPLGSKMASSALKAAGTLLKTAYKQLTSKTIEMTFVPPQSLTIIATPTGISSHFEINLMHFSDYVMHFEARQKERYIVLNSTCNGVWRQDERIRRYPFNAEERFLMKIYSGNPLKVSVNGIFLCDFAFHSTDPVNAVNIENLIVHEVSVS